jgi:hypothetical protein
MKTKQAFRTEQGLNKTTNKKTTCSTSTAESKDPASVVIKSRKNKQAQYLKFTNNEETGQTNVGFSDGVDRFFMGTHDLDIVNTIIEQTCSICSQGNQLTKKTTKIANAAMAAIIEIDPQDSAELMLASQMVAVHNISMEMSARAMLENQTFNGVEANIKRITKLMRTYTTQMEALNRYRTKGQQKITVQHVNVENGGQAIVGDVTQGGGND